MVVILRGMAAVGCGELALMVEVSPSSLTEMVGTEVALEERSCEGAIAAGTAIGEGERVLVSLTVAAFEAGVDGGFGD